MTHPVKHVFWPFCAQNYSGWLHFLRGGRALWRDTRWSCLLSVGNALSTAYSFFSFVFTSPPSGFEQKKKHEKKTPLSEKKPHHFSKKRALFGIISFLKRVFCLPLLHKISPFNVFKTINYLFLFFNISKTSYFTKQQTPLMIIISHNFKEIIFFIRID